MTSVLKPVADRYNLKNPEERYQFRRQVRKLLRWYSYITQVVRMFDTDMHKEYLFLSYLIGLLPEEKEEPIDLEGKLKLEYYKLQKTFEGAIKLEKVDGQYVPSKKQGAQGIRQKSTLDEILDKINEKYNDNKSPDFKKISLKKFFEKKNEEKYTRSSIHGVKGESYEAVLLHVKSRTGSTITPKLLMEGELEQELMRLAYVAMTRPRRLLMLAMPDTKGIKTCGRFSEELWTYENL